MQTIKEKTRQLIYDGNAEYIVNLFVGDQKIDVSDIKSITINDNIIDKESKYMYIGTFISKKLEIEFYNTLKIDLNQVVTLSIDIKEFDEEEILDSIPMGVFYVDTTEASYYDKAKLVCYDVAVKMKTPIDVEPFFNHDEKGVPTNVNIVHLLTSICNYYGIELGSYPNVNIDVSIGAYDSTLSGKAYISYIAELMASNAKIERDNKLYLIPVKSEETVADIDITKASEFTLGEPYEIGKVVFENGTVVPSVFGDGLGKTISSAVVTNSNIIQINDAVEANIRSLEILGNIEQDTNISPAYPQEIKTVGNNGLINIKQSTTEDDTYKEQNISISLMKKNYFNGSLHNGQINSVGGYSSNGTRITNATQTEDNNLFLKKGKYVIYSEGLNYVSLLTKNSEFGIIDNFATAWHALPFIFETTQDGYLYYTLRKSDNSSISPSSFVDKTFILEGTEISPFYELAKIGDVSDELDIVTGTLTKRIGKIVYNGTENWSIAQATKSFVLYNPFEIKDKEKYNANNIIPDIKSNYYEPITWQDMLDLKTGATLYYANGTLQIRLSSLLETVEEFKTWLSNNDVTIYYELAEPYTVQLGANVIRTYNGENTFTLESNVPASQIRLDYAIETHDANTLYIRADNMLLSGSDEERDRIIENIYHSVDGFKIYNIKIKNVTDLSLDSFDIVSYYDGENEYKSFYNVTNPILSLGTVETKLPTIQQEQTSNVNDNTSTNAKIRRVRSYIDQENSQIRTEIASNMSDTDKRLNGINEDLHVLNQTIQTISDTYTKTEIQEIISGVGVDGNVVTSVTTETGIFDKNGLTIDNDNEANSVKSNLNEEGLSVIEKSTNDKILYAGFDETTKETVVKSKNITVQKYLVVGSHSRFEDYVDENGNSGTGCFWLG